MTDLKDLETNDDDERSRQQQSRGRDLLRQNPLGVGVTDRFFPSSLGLARLPGSAELREVGSAAAALRQLPELAQMQSAVAALGQLSKMPTGDLVATAAAEMARRGDLGVSAMLAQRPDHAFGFGHTVLFDPVAEIVRTTEGFMRSEQRFLDDIRLSEQLLAATNLAQTVGATSPMATLLADIDKVSKIGQRVFEAHSVTLEQFSLAIDALDTSQLESRVRQATTQLQIEAERRGWTKPSSSTTSTAPQDTDQELPPELENILATASDEQASALLRVWNALGTQRANTFASLAVVFVTIVSLLVNQDHGPDEVTDDAGYPAEHAHDDAQDELTAGTASSSRAVLDAFGDDLELQAEIVQYLEAVDDVTQSTPSDLVRWTRWDQLVELLSRAPAIDEDRLYQAHRRAADQRELMASVKMLGAQEVATLMPGRFAPDADRTQMLAQLRSDGELLGVPVHGTWRYPAAQFDEQGRVFEPLCEVLERAATRGYDPWETLHWLATPRLARAVDAEPGRPIEGLSDGASLDEIVARAVDDDEARPDVPTSSPFEWLARGEFDTFLINANHWLD